MKLRTGKLQKIRDEYKLNVQDLANLLEISTQEYEEMERTGILDFEKIEKISEFFQIPLDEFLPDTTNFYNYNTGPIGVNMGTYNVYQTNDELIKYLLEQNRELTQRLQYLEMNSFVIPKGGVIFDDDNSESHNPNQEDKDKQ